MQAARLAKPWEVSVSGNANADNLLPAYVLVTAKSAA